MPADQRGLDGDELRGRREILGLSQQDTAERVRMSPSAYRHVEANHRRVPLGRVRDIDRALRPSGPELRQIRDEAGWTLKDMADLVGIHPGTWQRWETKKKTPPEDRWPAIWQALDVARREALSPLERMVKRYLAAVERSPGQTEKTLIHGLRDHHGDAGLAAKAAETARRRGLVHLRVETFEDLPGRYRSREVVVPGPPGEDAEPVPSMSKDELRALRTRAGYLCRQVGDLVGVSQGAITSYESGRHPIPPPRAAELRKALENLPAAEDPRQRARRLVLDAIDGRPGITRWTLVRALAPAVSSERLVRDAVAHLLRQRQLELRTRSGHQGRPCRGLYLRSQGGGLGTAPALSGSELRRQRRRTGLTLDVVAARAGVTARRIMRWEAGGKRPVNPLFVAALRAALVDPPPARDLAAAALPAVLAAVEREPGVARGRLRPIFDRNGGREALELALARGLVHEERRLFRDRRGHPRFRRGLYLGPASGAPTAATLELSAQQLAGARQAAGLSQSELARRLGVTQTIVNRWERHGPVPAGRVPEVKQVLAGHIDQPSNGKGRE
jgi:transcriptional regulator with XRE-family HTH domain